MEDFGHGTRVAGDFPLHELHSYTRTKCSKKYWDVGQSNSGYSFSFI